MLEQKPSSERVSVCSSVDKTKLFGIISVKRANSSVGESVSLTRRRSPVQVGFRPYEAFW